MMTGCTDKVFVICDISNLIYLLNCSHVLFDKLHSEVAIWQCGKIGALVNFIAQKLKSKQLVYLSFLW